MMDEPRDYSERDTHAPPEGYEQVGEVTTHSDPPLPEGVAQSYLDGEKFPKLARALNHVRADSGGPTWPAQGVTSIPARWEPYLARMELAVGSLSEQYPAPEDDAAVEAMLAGEALPYHESELYSFCCGEYHVMTSIAHRSDGLTMASNFIGDFFAGWSAYDDEGFDPLQTPDIEG